MCTPTRAAHIAVFVSAFVLACVEPARDADRSTELDDDSSSGEIEARSEPEVDARAPARANALDAATPRAHPFDARADTARPGNPADAGELAPDTMLLTEGGALDAASMLDEGDAAPPVCSDCCPDGFPRGAHGQALRRIAAFTPSPEGVTVCPDGEVFVAVDASGEVWHVPLSGAPPERWAQLGARRPAGIACDARGRLFVAIFASQSGETIPIEVLMITAKDAAPVAMPQPINGAPMQALNGIVAVPGLGVYASDSSTGNLVHVRELADGVFETRVVARDVTLANGLAYGPGARKLYAVASGALQLLAFDLEADGALGAPSEVPIDAFILFMDGVAVDETGELYVAAYLGGEVIRVSDGRAIAQLPTPASLAFRGGTLLITEYNLLSAETEGGLHALDLGVCGAPSSP